MKMIKMIVPHLFADREATGECPRGTWQLLFKKEGKAVSRLTLTSANHAAKKMKAV